MSWVRLAFIVGLAAVSACSKSSQPVEAVSPMATGVGPTPASAPTTPNDEAVRVNPVQIPRATGVRARVLSDQRVRVTWHRPPHEFDPVGRFWRIRDGGRFVGGHVAWRRRKADVTLAYGTHCLRVVAIATGKNEDSRPSKCAKVTVIEPLPPQPFCPPGQIPATNPLYPTPCAPIAEADY